MRDPSHMQQVEKWAEYVRKNPDAWKGKLKSFIDSQIIIAKRFYKRLLENDDGKEIIKQLRMLRLKK